MSLHEIRRVRRDTRRRLLTVDSVAALTPKMLRIEFSSPDMADFGSDAPDDHIKLFLPTAGKPSDGPIPDAFMRDYTPRAFDAAAGRMTIDFAVHEAGPATAWAVAAKPGDTLEIGGPRGSAIVPDDFDWYLLIGDETALPAITRRVEELREGVPVTTMVLIDDPAERQQVASRAAWTPLWLERSGQPQDDATLIREALDARPLPPGDGFVWIAAEAEVARAVRTHVSEALGHPRQWIKASGYWLRGQAGKDARIED